ncbi:hypothetical protein [Flammeovirga aprica]|uniref:Phage tail collar domain-containing protein n=1 Tax=Flammeovirga aprica JL-4 TaxID=694437 RepID=A0A7X9RSZ9_9BACT|nr:hypothetical protein [Flammeovirga aprica]NME66617.1 hypothetical protein [Flammeovirga aprica JL-4]
MKIFNIPAKGLILNTEDFRHINNISSDIVSILSLTLTENDSPVRIKGVEFSKDGQNYQCTEGWIMWQNTFYFVETFSGTAIGEEVPVFEIEKVSLPYEPHDLVEGYNKVGTFYVCQEEKLKPTFKASGTGLFDWNEIVKHPIKRNTEAITGLQGLLKGMIVDYYGSLVNFDATGLGIGEYIGYALCNGQNGTPDLRGRVTVGMSDTSLVNGNEEANLSEYFVLGNKGGQREITLTTNQIPPLSLPFATTALVPGIEGGDDDNHNNTNRFAGGDKPNGENPHFDISLNITGNAVKSTGGDSHENRQPFVVVGKLMKL